MTNLDYIKSKIGQNYPLDDATFEHALEASGIVPDDVYIISKGFDMAFIDLLVTLIASAERISEGGYTVQLNLDALRSLLLWYLNKWGLPAPGQPIIRGRRATQLW